MKLYICNWHGYYLSQNQPYDDETIMIKNCTAWQDALQASLHEVGIRCNGWKEEEPLCESVSLPDAQYEKWILSLLYREQKKPLPHTLTSLEDDRLFQKINDGFLTSELPMMWEPQAYLPIEKACIFDFVDPDQEPMCFGSLKAYCKNIRSLQEQSTTYNEVMNALQFGETNDLMLILESDDEESFEH